MKITFLSMLLVLASMLKAGAVLTLDQSLVAGLPGETHAYSGTITNTGGQDLFLNGISFTLGSSDLTFDSTSFFNLVPPSLGAGNFYSGQLFSVVASPTILAGDYGGSIGILGGPDVFTADEVASTDFVVRIVSDVPEPAYGGVITCIIAAFLVLKRKGAAE